MAIASGVKPEQGLYTTIIAGFVIAVLGGRRAQISGPTGAFMVIIYGIVLLLSTVTGQPLAARRQSGCLKRLGKATIAKDIFEAFERANSVLENSAIEKTRHD